MITLHERLYDVINDIDKVRYKLLVNILEGKGKEHEWLMRRLYDLLVELEKVLETVKTARLIEEYKKAKQRVELWKVNVLGAIDYYTRAKNIRLEDIPMSSDIKKLGKLIDKLLDSLSDIISYLEQVKLVARFEESELEKLLAELPKIKSKEDLAKYLKKDIPTYFKKRLAELIDKPEREMRREIGNMIREVRQALAYKKPERGRWFMLKILGSFSTKLSKIFGKVLNIDKFIEKKMKRIYIPPEVVVKRVKGLSFDNMVRKLYVLYHPANFSPERDLLVSLRNVFKRHKLQGTDVLRAVRQVIRKTPVESMYDEVIKKLKALVKDKELLAELTSTVESRKKRYKEMVELAESIRKGETPPPAFKKKPTPEYQFALQLREDTRKVIKRIKSKMKAVEEYKRKLRMLDEKIRKLKRELKGAELRREVARRQIAKYMAGLEAIEKLEQELPDISKFIEDIKHDLALLEEVYRYAEQYEVKKKKPLEETARIARDYARMIKQELTELEFLDRMVKERLKEVKQMTEKITGAVRRIKL